MQVNVETVSSVKKILHVEIPPETVTQKLDEAYKELKKTAKVKGFRPGKTPRSVLERLYKKNVLKDVTSMLIQETFPNAMAEHAPNFVGDPILDPTELAAGNAYKYDITVEITPDLKDVDLDGLKLTKTKYEISEDEIEAQLKMIQRTVTEKRTISEDRAATEGDSAIIDYEGLKDGKPYVHTQRTENFTYKIGSKMIHEKFDEQLAGMKSGEEKEISVTFPDHHPNPSLKGITIDFQVTLKEIQEDVLYDIDDAFAQKLGSFETLDQLKEDIAKNLEEGYQKRVDHELYEQIFSHLIEQQEFEVPEVLVNAELNQILSDIERSVDYHNKTMEDLGFTKEGLSEKYRDTAVKQVKRHMLLKKIIEQKQLELTDDELNAGFEDMAKALKQPIDPIKQFYGSSPDKLEVLKHGLLEKKAINLIIESSEITEKQPEPETRVEENQDDSKIITA
jgi:trigger factor